MSKKKGDSAAADVMVYEDVYMRAKKFAEVLATEPAARRHSAKVESGLRQNCGIIMAERFAWPVILVCRKVEIVIFWKKSPIFGHIRKT